MCQEWQMLQELQGGKCARNRKYLGGLADDPPAVWRKRLGAVGQTVQHRFAQSRHSMQQLLQQHVEVVPVLGQHSLNGRICHTPHTKAIIYYTMSSILRVEKVLSSQKYLYWFFNGNICFKATRPKKKYFKMSVCMLSSLSRPSTSAKATRPMQ